MFDRTQLDPRRPRRGRAFHKKEIAGGAVGIALHDHGSIFQMGQKDVRYVSVVLDQVAFGNFQLRPEELFKITEFDGATRDGDFKLLCAPGNLYSLRRTSGARRRRVFRWMIIAMRFGRSHFSHRFTQFGADKKAHGTAPSYSHRALARCWRPRQNETVFNGLPEAVKTANLESR